MVGFFFESTYFIALRRSGIFFLRDIIIFLQKPFLKHKVFQNIFFCSCERQNFFSSNLLTEISPFKLNGCSLIMDTYFLL